MNQSVSIIIPSYNRGDLIGETLKSVQLQTFEFWECIVVDDGSDDNSTEIISEYQKNDPRFRLIKREREPKGAPSCRNIGIEEARGEFILFLDSDDLLESSCLENRLFLFNKNPEYDFIVFNSRMFNSTPYDSDIIWNIDNEIPDILRFLKIDALWCISGPIYKKNFLKKTGGFNKDLKFWQDFDLHFRCILLGGNYRKFLNLPADVHIRNSRVDTISRSIPFAENKFILSQRIMIYFSFLDLVLKSEFKNDPLVIHSLYSMLFFLTSQNLLKHNDLKLFISQWKEVRLKLNLDVFPYFSSIIYCLILKAGNKLKTFQINLQVLERIDLLGLPSFSIMANNSMYKMKATPK